MGGAATDGQHYARVEDRATRERIACELLGLAALEDGAFARCPGEGLHSGRNGKRDFRVLLDGAPTGFCLHNSCSAAVEEFNERLRKAIWAAERGTASPLPYSMKGVAPRPEVRVKKRPVFDATRLRNYVAELPAVSREWIKGRSPLPVDVCSPADFIEQVFDMGERCVVFTEFFSQGDFLHEVGRGSFRLSDQRGVRAVRSALPGGGKEGVWFLSNPVSGEWVPSPSAPGKWTRRSWQNVTSWRHAVLESDVAEEGLWLRLLVRLELPIVAIYSSGGKSVHALVRLNASSKVEWDEQGAVLRQSLCPLGADGAALTAVRLTRLPGCLRGARVQELLYLNPSPSYRSIFA